MNRVPQHLKGLLAKFHERYNHAEDVDLCITCTGPVIDFLLFYNSAILMNAVDTPVAEGEIYTEVIWAATNAFISNLSTETSEYEYLRLEKIRDAARM